MAAATPPTLGAPLEELFADARSKFDVLDDAMGAADEEALAVAIAQFEQCATMVRSEGVTSINEEAEDMKTGDLQYLLTRWFVGELTMKQCGSASGREKDRLLAVQRGRAHLVSFVEACERKHMLDDFASVDWRKLSGDIDPDAIGAGRSRRVDPREARARKIEGYQREKAAKVRRQELLKLREASTRRGIDVDEERERELAMIDINDCISRALDDIRVADEETRLLEHRIGLDEDVPDDEDTRRHAAMTPADDVRSQPPQVIHIAADGTRSNIEIPMLTRGEYYREEIFRDGSSKPTMTLEELADMEIADARERAAKSKAKGPGPRKIKQLEEDGDEDDHALVDEATIKDRNWDDWCDANPRGSALTKRI